MQPTERHMPPQAPRSRAGFSLVESALALLVVGIGLLGVMGLFPAGLEMNRRAVDLTRASLFAEDVLSGLRAQVEQTPMGFENMTSLTVALHPAWNASPGQVQFTSSPITVRFHDGPGSTDKTEQVIKYVLEQKPAQNLTYEYVTVPSRNAAVQFPPSWWNPGSGTLQQTAPHNFGQPLPHMKRVRLRVWVGEHITPDGTTPVNTFYADFYHYD